MRREVAFRDPVLRRCSVEVENQLPQQPRQPFLIGGRERSEQFRLAQHELAHRVVDGGAPGIRHRHDDPPPVVWVGVPLDEAALDEPVDAVGHGAARDEGLLQQRFGARVERRPFAAERREHVELPRLQPRAREGVAPGSVEMLGEAPHAREHLQGREVERRMRALPCSDDAVDLVMLGHLPIIASARAAPRIREDGWVAIPVILDVDTGVDDALALLFAAAHPELELLGVSCVAGNASLERVVENTLRVLALAGAPDVPVAAGAHRPLIESPRDASHVHGIDGLGGVELPPAARRAEPDAAVAFLRRRILEHPEPVTLVALAPQTNLALLLRLHPEVASNIARIVFVGGSTGVGNATALAEFNVWHDPEAAAIVLDAGVPLYMYGLDVFNHVAVPREVTDALAASAELLPSVVARLLDHRIADADGTPGDYRGWIGDAGALCSIVAPDAFRVERLPMRVELAGYGRGQTIVDRREHPGEDALHGLTMEWTSVDVALGVDADRVARLFLDTVL